MSIKPILFNTEMVRAILDGRKSCTRRIVKHDVEAILNSPYHKEHPEVEDEQIISKLCIPPYQPGDILYVRETFIQAAANIFWYKADDKLWMSKDLLWKPSIHMPKKAARIWLKVTDVRVERLQEITESGAKAEGIRGYTKDGNLYKYAVTDDWWIDYHNKHKEIVTGTWWQDMPRTAKDAFSYLWNSTIKKSDLDLYGWNANPWVWTIEYERCEKPEGV